MQTVPTSRLESESIEKIPPLDTNSHADRESLISEWVDWMVQTKNLSPNTVRLYLRTVEKFSLEVDDFLYASEEQVQAWLQNQKGKAGTFNNRVSGLASFYRFAKKRKLRIDNPCSDLDRPKQHKRLPKPVEDLETKLAILDELDRNCDRRVGETRDMVIFLCHTGLRIHEAVGCKWPVPCPEEAFIIGKGSKEELMEIHTKARQAWDRLGGQWGTKDDGGPIGARATQRRFEKAGFHPHQCRHWLATSLIRAGKEIGTVSKIMRHSSVQTTMGYSAYQKKMFKDALSALD